MGIGEAGLKEWSQSDSESGNSSGGKEKCPYVELPFLSSCIVMRAATVFLNMLCSAMISASLSFRSAGPAEAGNTASIMDSQSLTSFEMSSVVKNGCFSTCSINGNLRRQPVRLSYFFKILARPEWCRMCIRNDWYIYLKWMKWYGSGNDWLVTPEFFGTGFMYQLSIRSSAGIFILGTRPTSKSGWYTIHIGCNGYRTEHTDIVAWSHVVTFSRKLLPGTVYSFFCLIQLLGPLLNLVYSTISHTLWHNNKILVSSKLIIIDFLTWL